MCIPGDGQILLWAGVRVWGGPCLYHICSAPHPWKRECTRSILALLELKRDKAMATYSGTLAWKIPWTEEPGGLQSMGSLRSDMTERLHFHFSLSCIGEGNGNPLQCSCLENPRDGGAWWAVVSGVAQSRTRLKRLSSSSSSMVCALVYRLQTQSFLPLNYLSYFPLILFPSFIFY